jgi:hypothetical protein
LNNGYSHLHQPPSAESIIMDYESSSDAALLEEQRQPALNRDTSTNLLLDVNQQQPQPHSNIINNPASTASASPQQHAPSVGSFRNSISPISTSPTANKSQVVVNLDYPNSMQTITTLQRNNVKNSSTNSNRSQVNAINASNNMLSSIGNSIKATSDNGKIFNASNNRKYKFNLLKLSSSSSRAERSTRNRLLIVAICLIIFGIAIGALFVHLIGIYHCNPDRIGMYEAREQLSLASCPEYLIAMLYHTARPPPPPQAQDERIFSHASESVKVDDDHHVDDDVVIRNEEK